MNEIRAVFWDIDGTMVMSEPVHDAKMFHLAKTHGFSIPHDIHSQFHGTGDLRAFELMQQAGMPGTLEQFLEACHDFYRSQLHTIDVREGFAEAFALFDQAGVHQCAVSNGVKVLVEMNLGRAAIREKLVAVIDLDDMQAGGLQPKPAADPYLEALRLVNDKTGANISPHECLVVEDSPTGVKAGKAAGMNVIYWMLEPGKTMPEADFEAYTGQELLDTIAPFFRKKLSA